MRIRTLACTLAVLLVGCDAVAGTAGDAVVRDSAGIRIVENTAGTGQEDQAWTVDPEPALAIGLVEGDEPYLLDDVRGAALLSAGRVVVLNSGSAELRLYDEAGRFLRATGGLGGGPGQFRFAPKQLIRIQGDTLLVFDGVEVSRFDGSLDFVDRVAVDRQRIASARPEGLFGEGSYLLPDGALLAPAHERPPPDAGGDYRAPGGFVRVGPDGHAALLRPFSSAAYSLPPFSPSSHHAAGGDSPRLAIGDGAAYEISIFSTDGTLIQRVRNSRPNDAVLPEDLARLRTAVAAAAPNPEQAAARLQRFDQMTFSTSYPAFEALFIDRTSHLWVRRRGIPPFFSATSNAGDAAPTTVWDIYDPEGLMLGAVRLPEMLVVHDAGTGFVLGMFTPDEFGTQQVRLYPLTRSGDR